MAKLKISKTLLQKQLILALVQMQKISGMDHALQPCINALRDKKTYLPEGDYDNISRLKDLIFELHKEKLQTSENVFFANTLVELAEGKSKKYSRVTKSKGKY